MLYTLIFFHIALRYNITVLPLNSVYLKSLIFQFFSPLIPKISFTENAKIISVLQ